MIKTLDFIIAKIEDDQVRNLTSSRIETNAMLERNEVYKEVIDFLKVVKAYGGIRND